MRDPVPPGDLDVCSWARRWTVREDVMRKVLLAAQQFERETGRRVSIISGYRTPQKQAELKRQGRPAADPSKSTHLSCPATGVDVSLGFAPTRAMRATWGRIASDLGLRWGGGSPVDSGGIPEDWNHVDVGPRKPGT